MLHYYYYYYLFVPLRSSTASPLFRNRHTGVIKGLGRHSLSALYRPHFRWVHTTRLASPQGEEGMGHTFTVVTKNILLVVFSVLYVAVLIQVAANAE